MRFPSDPASRRRVSRLRLAAQRLTGGRAASPADAVRGMLAMQGQDYPGVKWSVGLRSGATEAEVGAALDAGEIVRSWPLRGTLHLVAAEDLPWLLSLTAARATAGADQRRQVVGITLEEIERAREAAVAALPGRTAGTRSELLGAVAAAGIPTHGQRGYHLLWFLAQTGTLVLGPTRGREQSFARLDAWVPRPRRLDRDEALGELAARYFRSHGPATVADLVRWSGLGVRDVRRGVAVAGAALATVSIEGLDHLLAPELLEDAATIGARPAPVLLLPGFDEVVLGYRDRSAVLAPEHAEGVVPGGNGMFKATLVVDGEVVGTWGRKERASGVSVEPRAFDGALPAGAAAGLSEAAAAYARFLDRPVRLVEPAVTRPGAP